MTFPKVTPWPFATQLRLVACAMLLSLISLMFTDWIGRLFMDAAILVGAVAGFGILNVWRRLELASAG